jgi:hypothetical protein
MSLRVVLNDKERDAILQYHLTQIESIKENIKELKLTLDETYSRFEELAGYPHPDINKGVETLFPTLRYSSNMPLWQKVHFALNAFGSCATTRRIADFILHQENIDASPRDVSRMVGALAATLKQKYDKKEAFDRVVEPAMGDSFWGLKEWFDKPGVPSDGFKPDFMRLS